MVCHNTMIILHIEIIHAVLHPTLFNESCSYSVQPLTLVGALTLLIIASVWILWHFEILWTHNAWCLGPELVTALQPEIFNISYSYLVQPLTLIGIWTLLIMIHFLGFCGTSKYYEYTLTGVFRFVMALQPTIFRGSCLCFVELLTLVRAWTLCSMGFMFIS